MKLPPKSRYFQSPKQTFLTIFSAKTPVPPKYPLFRFL